MFRVSGPSNFLIRRKIAVKLNLSAEAMVYGQMDTAGNGTFPMVCSLVSGVKMMGSNVHWFQTCLMENMQIIIDAPIAPDHLNDKLSGCEMPTVLELRSRTYRSNQ